MSSEHIHTKVRRRNDTFAEKTATKIWGEHASDDNPYIAQSALCHGYDLYELMDKRSFVDVFYLLFRGELPSTEEAQLLETLMIALINPGPRHPATRAAMNAGVGKTDPVHILPIASAILGGQHLGGGEIEAAMRFLRKQQHKNPADTAKLLYTTPRDGTYNADTEPSDTNTTHKKNAHNNTPGFGSRYGGIDLMADNIAQRLSQHTIYQQGRALGEHSMLQWGIEFSAQLHSQGAGWLNTGVAAAIFADLGFQPRMGGCLFQLLGAPGLVAHGIEIANKPITAMPFIKDEDYAIEK